MEEIIEFFEKYKTYYQILGLNDQNVTDEQVKEAYDNMCMQLNGIFTRVSGEKAEKLKERIQEALDDAYRALKTEYSRKNYEELLNSIDSKSEENER